MSGSEPCLLHITKNPIINKIILKYNTIKNKIIKGETIRVQTLVHFTKILKKMTIWAKTIRAAWFNIKKINKKINVEVFNIFPKLKLKENPLHQIDKKLRIIIIIWKKIIAPQFSISISVILLNKGISPIK